MLAIYRRHTKLCAHCSEGREYQHCRCPIWINGFIGQQEIRKTLDTRDWGTAQRIIREWEAEGEHRWEAKPVTIAEACEQFLRDAEARLLRQPSIYGYRLLFRQLQGFAEAKGSRFLNELDPPILRQFLAPWTDHNMSALKRLKRLRAFFNFAHKSNWITANPVRYFRTPKVAHRPVMPFTPEEMAEILAACEKNGAKCRDGKYSADERIRRIRAFVLVLRYTGLRLHEAVALERSRIEGDKLLLRIAKTGTPVYVPLPPFVLAALADVPNVSEKYVFWSDGSRPEAAMRAWSRTLKGVFREAGIPDGRAHRFRETFAVELFEAGAPSYYVSLLLGHSSVHTTERHLAPWTPARLELIEIAIRRTWDSGKKLLAGFHNGLKKTA